MTENASPSAIGPFVVLRKLGEGAMGVVYAGFDVALDRKVALKLIRRQLLGDDELRARMMREAQAMARLSHPNVVQVYQVGEHDREIYVAMEYVEGQTLTAWLKAEKRGWTAALRVVIGAGRGLAAAHAAGLVHRDFKPDNVLVGKNGHARVVDFGLVHTEDAAQMLGTEPYASVPGLSVAGLSVVGQSVAGLSLAGSRVSTVPGGLLERSEVGERSGVLGSVRLTQVGKALGTPAYMSPEQHFGEAVGAASDQFSFSVTLYEALYGVRPFRGKTWADIKRAVRRGQLSPPRESPVPARIFKIVARGLAATPEQRWPGLAAMLDALERDPRRAWLRGVGVAGLVGVAAVGGYVGTRYQRDAHEQCQGAAQRLRGAWDEELASAGERAFAATGAAFSADVWQRVRARLDAYAGSWSAEHTRACEAHASGAESTHLFDLRTQCLARRRSHLAALVEVLVVADRAAIENAVQATAALPAVASCGDAEALLAGVAAPADPATATRVEVLRGLLARAAALEGTGQYTQGLTLARSVRGQARALRYAPLAAEAALVEGSLAMAVADAAAAEEALTAALRMAIEQGLEAVAAEAAAKRIFVIGEELGRRAMALDGEAVAEALAVRARDDGRIAALLHNNLGAIEATDGTDGASARARGHYLRTIELLDRSGARDPLIAVVHHNLGGLLRAQGELGAAREHYAQAFALFSELLGAHHPLAAHPLGGMADVDVREGHFAAAREGYMRALALMEGSYGSEHLYLLHPLVGLGQAEAGLGDAVAATRYLRRAVAIGGGLGTMHPMYAEALEGLAQQLAGSEPREARALFAQAVTVHEAAGGPENPALAGAVLGGGELAAAAGDMPAARAAYERVLSVTTGRKDQVEVRSRAGLGLARALVAEGEGGPQACALVEAVVLADVGQRAAAESLRAAACEHSER